MNDREFDALLESAAPELPPDDVARDVTPWRRAIGNILGGSAMCSITLNFFCLNYLLLSVVIPICTSVLTDLPHGWTGRSHAAFPLLWRDSVWTLHGRR